VSLSQAEARAKLERIVRKAPEVMVKVSGKQYGAHHLSEHFGYVARHGKLARSSEGEIIDDPKRLKEIAQDWAMLDEAMNEHGRDRPTSLSLVLSMPSGSADPRRCRMPPRRSPGSCSRTITPICWRSTPIPIIRTSI
jgi:hypothetical protein